MSGNDEDGSESGAAILMRYALLLALGFSGLFVLLVSLTASIQLIALGAGANRTGIAQAGIWGMALVVAISAVPLMRFSLAEAPDLLALLARAWRRPVLLMLISLAAGILFASL